MATEPHEFRPDWCIAPAEHLREWMEDNGVKPRLIAAIWSGRDEERKTAALALVQDVLDRKPLTETHAAVLARGTFIPARFWLGLETNYRNGLAAGLKDVTDDSAPAGAVQEDGGPVSKLTKGTMAAVVRAAPCPYCREDAGQRCISSGGRELARPHGDRMAFYAMTDEGRREMFPHMFKQPDGR
jgi:hypothetical protein